MCFYSQAERRGFFGMTVSAIYLVRLSVRRSNFAIFRYVLTQWQYEIDNRVRLIYSCFHTFKTIHVKGIS